MVTRDELRLIIQVRDYLRECADLNLAWRFNPFQKRWPKGSGDKSGEWKPKAGAKKAIAKKTAVKKATKKRPAPKRAAKQQTVRKPAQSRPAASKVALRPSTTMRHNERPPARSARAAYRKQYLDTEQRPDVEGRQSQISIVEDSSGKKKIFKISRSIDEANSEEIASVAGERLGVLVPRVERVDDRATSHEYIDGQTLLAVQERKQWGPIEVDYLLGSPDYDAYALFDSAFGNPDRHQGNVFLGDDGKVYSIDSGQFGWAERGVGVYGDAAERSTMTLEKVEDFQRRFGTLKPEFDRIYGPEEGPKKYAAAQGRLDRVKRDISSPSWNPARRFTYEDVKAEKRKRVAGDRFRELRRIGDGNRTREQEQEMRELLRVIAQGGRLS